jgi:uncharacterized protein YukE
MNQPTDADVPDRVISARAGGRDGGDIEADVSAHLDYLRRLCGELGVPDPVEEYFAPVVGRWSDMHDEAERWRAAGVRADKVADDLTKPLGGLDNAWQGADAESFIDYMNRIGLAGHDMSDAMDAMAEVLDATADGLRGIVTDMAGVLAETAETASEAMSLPGLGEHRTRQYLDHMKQPTSELFESVRQVLEALVKLCEGIDGSQVFDKITLAHSVPVDNWTYTPEMPVIPSAVIPSAVIPSGAAPSPAPEPAPVPAAEPAHAVKGGGGGGGAASIGGGGGGGGAGSASKPPVPQPGGYVMAGEAGPAPAAGLPPAAAAAASGGNEGGRSGGMGGGMPMMGGRDGWRRHRAQVTQPRRRRPHGDLRQTDQDLGRGDRRRPEPDLDF